MHSVTLFVQISRHSSKLGQMEVELGSLKYAQVAFGAKKSKMVLFCRKSGKLDLRRKKVATTARVQTRREKRAMTRNMRGFFPTTQGTQTAVKEDSNPKKIASSSSTRAERRLTSPLEKSPKALRNLSWNPRKKKLKLLAR